MALSLSKKKKKASHGRVNGSVRVFIGMAATAVDLVRFGRIAAYATAAARGDCHGNGRGDSLAAGTGERQRV